MTDPNKWFDLLGPEWEDILTWLTGTKEWRGRVITSSDFGRKGINVFDGEYVAREYFIQLKEEWDKSLEARVYRALKELESI